MRWARILASVVSLGVALIVPGIADPLAIVAAENFYGDVAKQIGGDEISVTSVLASPDQDPHLFEASPSTARTLATAKIVVVNGADYDPWMTKLLAAHLAPGRLEISVAALVHKMPGANPHLWYDLAAMKIFANRFANELAAADSAHKSDYEKRLAKFIESINAIDAKIAELKKKYSNVPVAASEPVFGYMAQALGLTMRDVGFQLAVMNNTEPNVSDVAAFENDLRGHKIRALIVNVQASEPAVDVLIKLAKAERIPVVGITETLPRGRNYQDWMLDQLETLDKALAGEMP